MTWFIYANHTTNSVKPGNAQSTCVCIQEDGCFSASANKWLGNRQSFILMDIINSFFFFFLIWAIIQGMSLIVRGKREKRKNGKVDDVAWWGPRKFCRTAVLDPANTKLLVAILTYPAAQTEIINYIFQQSISINFVHIQINFWVLKREKSAKKSGLFS